MFNRLPVSAATLLVLAAGSRGAVADCLTDWGAAGDIVRANGLQTVEQWSRNFAQQLDGQIIRATLCEEGGSYVYRLVVRDRTGQMKSVVLDASGAGLAARSR